MIETILTGESKDILNENIQILKELFPEIVSEDKIDFDKFKTIFGAEIDDSSERYAFTWPDKNNSIKESQKLSNGTLRPCKEESKNWDTTKNLYIEGENLEVLKLLQKGYFNKIKMIYIDPPYNRDGDYIYHDNYGDNLSDYLNRSNQLSEDGLNLTSNVETNGRFHTDWLNMMFSRLKLARNLLKDNGVIFISIDDAEIVNLLKICTEIFGEGNVDVMIWRKSGVGRDGKMKNTPTFRKDHEYVVVCFKRIIKLNKSFEKPQWEKSYGNRDNDPRGNYEAGSISRTEDSSNPDHENYYSVVSPSGKIITRQFEISKEEFDKLDADNRIWWGQKGDGVPRIKIFENEEREVTTSSLLSISDELNSDVIDDKECTTTKGSKQLDELFNIQGIGNEMRPKPVELIKKLIRVGSSDNDIILDFFSGSATTFQAILEFNNTYETSRRSILVQIPQPIKENTESYKAGFKNIFELGRNRMLKVSERYDDMKNFDNGFKVFKLDSSNLIKWDPDYNNLEQTLLVAEHNIKPDRSKEDLIYEIMLKYGIDLTLPVEKYENRNTIYSIGAGALLICLDDNITKDITNDIIELAKDSEISRVVFKDNGFVSDADKTNIKKILEVNGIEKFITF